MSLEQSAHPGDVDNDAQDLLEAVFAALAGKILKHGSRTLAQHLVRTSELLKHWNQGDIEQKAALFHSVYSTDIYQRASISRANRCKLRSFIGDEAELIVFFFGSTTRTELFAALDKCGEIPSCGVHLSDRATGQRYAIPHEAVRSLIVIHMANMAEQAKEKDCSPGQWLNRFGKLAAIVNKLPGAPMICRLAPLVRSREHETSLIEAYAKMMSHRGLDYDKTSELCHACINAAPALFEPRIILSLLRSVGRVSQETQIRPWDIGTLIAMWGVAWDKRLTTEQWRCLHNHIEKDRLGAGQVRQCRNNNSELVTSPTVLDYIRRRVSLHCRV
jgi:hypothetical protein